MARLGLWGLALLCSLSAYATQNRRLPSEWLSHDQLAKRLGCQALLTAEFTLPGRVDPILRKIRVFGRLADGRFKLDKLIQTIEPKRSFYLGWGLRPNEASFRQRVLVRKIMPQSDSLETYLRLRQRFKQTNGSLVGLIKGSVKPEPGFQYQEVESNFISQFSEHFVEVGETQFVDFFNQQQRPVSDFLSLQVWLYHDNAGPFTEDEIANLVTAYELVIKPHLSEGQSLEVEAYVVTKFKNLDVIYSTTIQPLVSQSVEVGPLGPEASSLLDKLKHTK